MQLRVKDLCAAAALVLAGSGGFAMVGAMSALPLEITLPPPRYDHEPSVRYEIMEVHWADVNRLCQGVDPMPGAKRALGCARRFGPLGWTIIMPKRDGSLLADDWERLLRHEKGHVNGWPKDHPCARLVGGYRVDGC